MLITDRRSPLSTCLALILLAVAQTLQAAVYAPPASPRLDTLIDAGWKFHKGDLAGAAVPGLDDSGWFGVSIPHTWNAVDGQDGGANYYRGIGWYRRHLVIPPELRGRKLYLQFDGANTQAEVWVNGQLAGSHKGGYTAFRIDATRLLSVGADNLIAVKVDNSASNDITPLVADFTFFGGLYRHVHLLATDRLQISALDQGGPGVYLTQSAVSSASASLSIRSRITDGYATPRPTTVDAYVVDREGNVVQAASTAQTLDSGETRDVVQDVTLGQPHLWGGLASPYLYTVYVEVRSAGQLTDLVKQPLGFRSVYLDPVAGLFLNGAHVDVRGVSRHQDRLDKGWALTTADHDEDFALIREIGANAVRLAHYPQDPYVYDLCDRTGFLVWSEIPLTNRISDSAAFSESARRQLVEMIRQNYNHPSVFLWGVSNEALLYSGPDPRPLMSRLSALAHREDPMRFTVLAHNGTSTDRIVRITDTVGFNQYFGWYKGIASELGPWADQAHRIHPERPLALSEYGAGGNPGQHQDSAPPPVPGGVWHPEEYQASAHEVQWRLLDSRPFLWGKFIWTMFDFASDARYEGDAPGRNDKGLVSYDRRVRKDAFFWYKANWSADPVVYITSRRQQPRPVGPATIKVYANTDTVELRVNQVSLGTKSAGGPAFVWPDVPLRAGANVVEAVGMRSGSRHVDSVVLNAADPGEGLRFLVSGLADRTGAVPLAGASLYGPAAIFTLPEAGVSQVDFWLDNATPENPTGPVTRRERSAPFDLGGSATNGGAIPLVLAPGLHTVTALATVNGAPRPPVSVSFSVGAEFNVRLMLSAASDRRQPTPLQGATLHGDAYIFTTPDSGIEQVSFWIDDPTPADPTGAPARIEGAAPFDLAGTAANGLANPLKWSNLAAGTHRVTARVRIGGVTRAPVTASFDVGTPNSSN